MFRFNINTIKFFLTFFIATMLFAVVQAYAVWQDAPAAPAQYGTTPGTTQDDYKPVNLGDTIQTKSGGLNIMGNVGIGTAPSFSIGRGLHISGVAGTPDAVIKLSETTSGLGNFELRSVARGTSGNRLEIGEGSDAFLTIRSDDDGGGTTSRGNVGIGTTAPNTKLSVVNSTGSTYGLTIANSADNLMLLLGDTTGGLMNIQGKTLNAGTVYNIALQAEGGNVGIGTTDPGAYKLNVAGDASATRLCIAGDCRASWDAVTGGTQTLDSVTTNDNITSNDITVSRLTASVFSDRQGSSYYVDPAGATSAIFAGNVGIGAVTVPAYRLDVTGTIRANGGLIIDVRASDPSSPAVGQMWLIQ